MLYHKRDSLKLLYFTHFRSKVNCGIILGGNSGNSNKLFLIQKKIIVFRQLDILPVTWLY